MRKRPRIFHVPTLVLYTRSDLLSIRYPVHPTILWGGRHSHCGAGLVGNLFPTPWACSLPGFSVHHQLPEFTQTHVHRVCDGIQPSHPLSSPSPPAPNPSQHQSFPMSQLFAWGGQSTGVFSFSIIPSKEIPGLISFRMDWLDLLAVQGTLKSNNTREDSTHGHHQMVNTETRLIIFFAAKDGEALYSQQKQDQELTVAQIMNSLLPSSDWNWRK